MIQIFDGLLKLGVTGAVIFLLIYFGDKFFKYLETRSKSEGNSGSKFDRLCDKIDKLITSNHDLSESIVKSTLQANNDNETIYKTLSLILESSLDTQRRVVRVDDRTFKCLGNPEERKEKKCLE